MLDRILSDLRDRDYSVAAFVVRTPEGAIADYGL